MENGLFARAAEFISRQRNMKRWQKVVTAMAAVVVFGTTYALILPAITLENNVFCGQEEHVHKAKCYDTQLICGQEEAQGHVHSDSCYQIETNLVCDLEETPGHTHTDACMTVESTLTCANTEEGHVHGDGCYTTTSSVTCGQAETAGHTHGDGCYMKNSVLICTESTEVPEGGHVHTDACYSQGEETTCGKEEHKHDAGCRSNHNADTESRDEWEKTMEDVELTGEFPADVLAIAESQLGYTESKTNYIYDEEEDRKLGYSRYGAWYGNAYGDWCAMFVSFCLHYAEISAEDFPREAGCQRWIEDLTELELYLEVEDHYPVPGDLIFFNWDEEPDSDHVGLVKEIILDKDGNPEKIKTIEGNSSNKVQHVTYQWGDDSIMGYGDLTKAYQLWLEKQEQEEAEDGADDQEEPQTLTFENDDLSLVASYGPEAGIPDDAELVVEPIEPGDLEQDYISYFKLAQAALNPQSEEEEALDPESQDAQLEEEGDPESQDAKPEDGEEEEPGIQDFRLYDISLKSQDQEIIPQAPVTLKLTVPAPPSPEEGSEEPISKFSLLRFGETATEEPEVQPLVEEEPGELTTTFALRANSSDDMVATAAVTVNDKDDRVTVLFDGQLGSHEYYADSNNLSPIKYEGAPRMLVYGDDNGMVKLPTAAEFAAAGSTYYPYRVVGWYDIVNNVYYGEHLLGTEIQLTADTVFYPDYVATNYNFGTASGNLEADIADTSSFVDVDVFDYNELFNMRSATYVGSRIDLLEGDTGTYHTGNWALNTGSGSLGFVFSDWIRDPASDSTGNNQGYTPESGNIDGNIGRVFDLGTANSNNSKSRDDDDINIGVGETIPFYGNITNNLFTDVRSTALFTPATARPTSGAPLQNANTQTLGREYLGKGDWLFSYDPNTGYYYYNSALNAASYNADDDRFYVYDKPVNVDNTYSLHDFLPLNDGRNGVELRERNTVVNFWFGMKTEIEFYLPETVGAGVTSNMNVSMNKDSQTSPMEFRFAGDDDVWVFVDNQLVLDMGGVHDIVYGAINFAEGTWTLGQSGAYNTGVSDPLLMPGVRANDVNKANTGVTSGNLNTLAAGNHTLTIYYLERGSSLSNCAMYFNISPVYELKLCKQDKDGKSLLEGAVFEVYDNKECTDPATLYETDGKGNRTELSNNRFTTDENGELYCWGFNAGETYYIKEVEPPHVAGDPDKKYPDMRDHIIELNLSASGKPTVVILDSNGNKDSDWVFADAHEYSATGNRIILNVYNDEYVGGEKEVYVEKVWEGGEPPANTEITVKLYVTPKNDVGESYTGAIPGETDTGRSMVLNAQNGWKGVFKALPNPPEGYTYTVREDPIPSGYAVEYTTKSGNVSTESTTEGWVPVTKLTSGKKYLLVRNNGSSNANILTTAGSNSEFMVWSTEDLTKLLSTKPSDIKPGIVWEATGQNDYQLKTLGHNCAMWLYHPTNGTDGANIFVKNSTPDGSNFKGRVVLDEDNGKLYLYMVGNGSNKYYFSNNAYTGTHGSSGSNYKSQASTSKNNATTFTIYEWTETTTTTAGETIPGWRITNTEIPEGSYELPETGGPGAHWYILGGILLITGGTLCYRKQEHGKEGPTTS